MDGVAVGFVILMVVLGGLSAYVADILGYKIGKKRLSLWRIRPKYVARTSVVVMGMLIPLITILLLYGASADFRTWLTKGRQAIEESKIKSAELEKLQVELERSSATLKNQIRVYEADINDKQKEISEKQKSLFALTASAKVQAEELKNLKGQKEKLQTTFTKVQTSLRTAESSLKNADAALKNSKKELDEVNVKLNDSKQKYQEAKSEYDKTTSQNLKLTIQNGDLQKQNEEYQTKVASMQTDLENLTKSIEALQKDKMKAETEAKAAQKELLEVQEALGTITENIRQMRSKFASDLQETSRYARTSPISFLKGEELGRVTVPAKLTEAAATGVYRTLMRKARAAATAKGAAPDPELYPFADNVGFIAYDTFGRPLSEAQVDRYWIEELLKVPQNSMAVVRAWNNRFSKEPVALTLEVYPNPIVFRKGEIIAETPIDGRGSELEIRKTIREFLRTFVNTKARSRKMIPVQTRDGETFGEFSEEQYFNASVQAKKIPRILRLVAVAQDDIRAADPLQILLEFR